MASDLLFDDPRGLAQFSRDKRQINLLDCSRGKLPRQLTMRFVILRNDHATTRLLIQPMDDSRSLFATDSGKRRAMMKQCVDQRVLLMALPAYCREVKCVISTCGCRSSSRINS